MGETIVFFRDDDVGELTDPLRFHVDLLLEHGIACHYQVVPCYLDAEAAGWLRRVKAEHADLVHLDQHGLRHEQTLGGELVYSEFAGGRDFDDQLTDIREGRDRLADALGDAFSAQVFTPPCHKYDARTLRALGELGFDTLSAGIRTDLPSRLYYAIGRGLGRVDFLGRRVSYHCQRTPQPELAEVSCTIDVHQDTDARGERLDKALDRLWAEFEAARARLDCVGVMTHHQVCDTPELQATLRRFVEKLHAEPGVRFAALRDLAPQSEAA